MDKIRELRRCSECDKEASLPILSTKTLEQIEKGEEDWADILIEATTALKYHEEMCDKAKKIADEWLRGFTLSIPIEKLDVWNKEVERIKEGGIDEDQAQQYVLDVHDRFSICETCYILGYLEGYRVVYTELREEIL